MSKDLQGPVRPVFFDRKGHRSKVFGYGGITLAVAATLLMAVFIVSVLINPFLPELHLKSAAALPQQGDANAKEIALIRMLVDNHSSETLRRLLAEDPAAVAEAIDAAKRRLQER